MPTAALRPCTYPGCSNLVKSGRCTDHQVDPVDVYHRDKNIKRLYDSDRWKRLRGQFITKNPWCAECLKNNRHTLATDVDHIDPHEGDELKFFAGPFQSLCHSCHAAKTGRERGGRKKF